MQRPPLYPQVVVGFEPNQRGEDARALGELIARTAGGSVRQVHIEDGPAGRGLQELAERGRADLIVLGSTHRAAIGSIAPGSVAEHLLGGAPCRIAIAPRGYARARAVLAVEQAGATADDVPAGEPLPLVRDELRVVAVGYNGTPESRAALEESVLLAGRGPAAIRLIGITEVLPRLPDRARSAAPPPGSVPGRDGTADLETALSAAAAELPSELRALSVHERGDPVERLLEQAAQGVDLLVLGSRGFGPVMRVLVGSVSAKVVRRASCPVLIVPRPGSRGKSQ